MFPSEEEEGVVEEGLQVVKMVGTMETCIVGYLPRAVVLYDRERFIGKYGIVTELCANSEDVETRRRS